MGGMSNPTLEEGSMGRHTAPSFARLIPSRPSCQFIRKLYRQDFSPRLSQGPWYWPIFESRGSLPSDGPEFENVGGVPMATSPDYRLQFFTSTNFRFRSDLLFPSSDRLTVRCSRYPCRQLLPDRIAGIRWRSYYSATAGSGNGPERLVKP
jgi:hypothetical protein